MNDKKELFLGNENSMNPFSKKIGKLSVFALIAVAAFSIVSEFMSSLIQNVLFLWVDEGVMTSSQAIIKLLEDVSVAVVGILPLAAIVVGCLMKKKLIALIGAGAQAIWSAGSFISVCAGMITALAMGNSSGIIIVSYVLDLLVASVAFIAAAALALSILFIEKEEKVTPLIAAGTQVLLLLTHAISAIVALVIGFEEIIDIFDGYFFGALAALCRATNHIAPSITCIAVAFFAFVIFMSKNKKKADAVETPAEEAETVDAEQ